MGPHGGDICDLLHFALQGDISPSVSAMGSSPMANLCVVAHAAQPSLNNGTYQFNEVSLEKEIMRDCACFEDSSWNVRICSVESRWQLGDPGPRQLNGKAWRKLGREENGKQHLRVAISGGSPERAARVTLTVFSVFECQPVA
jgi:hypothetical protein